MHTISGYIATMGSRFAYFPTIYLSFFALRTSMKLPELLPALSEKAQLRTWWLPPTGIKFYQFMVG